MVAHRDLEALKNTNWFKRYDDMLCKAGFVFDEKSSEIKFSMNDYYRTIYFAQGEVVYKKNDVSIVFSVDNDENSGGFTSGSFCDLDLYLDIVLGEKSISMIDGTLHDNGDIYQERRDIIKAFNLFNELLSISKEYEWWNLCKEIFA